MLRPHVLTLFLLAVLLTLLARERWRWIPPLFLLWANAHGGVVLGGLVLAAAWAAAVLRWWRVRARRRSRGALRALSVVVALSGLACAAAPLGFGIYRFVIESTARSIAGRRSSSGFRSAPTDVLRRPVLGGHARVRRAARARAPRASCAGPRRRGPTG